MSSLRCIYHGKLVGQGSDSQSYGDKGILYESGTWVTDWKAEFSNFREADNLVTKIASLVEAGDIQGQEDLLFTDNSTFESTCYHRYSTSWKPSGIILQLYQTIQDEALIIHAIHMDGTSVKAWG